MSELAWITASGLLMSAIALVGSVTLLVREAALRVLLLPLVALAAIAAGNFIYIAATDLVPELTGHRDLAGNALHWGMFVLGAGLMYATKLIGL